MSFIFFSLTLCLPLTINSDVAAQDLHKENLYQITNQPSKLANDYHIPVGDRPVFIESTNDKLYVANSASGTISVISTENDTRIGDDISVGLWPRDLNSFYDKLYVANSVSGTISVINTTTDTRIGKDIPVGEEPRFIYYDYYQGQLYVANFGLDTISVVNTTTDTRIGKDIPVGAIPVFIESTNDKLYVANFGLDTISVINTTTNTRIGKDIPVGDRPSYLDFDILRNAIYVANQGSDSISVIDALSDKVVGRVTFDVIPPRSGNIECGGNIVPFGKSFYLDSGIRCKALPNKGFEFLSWEENLGENSTRLINNSKPASPLESVLDNFNFRPQEPEAVLAVTKFGTFTANFKELPPPLPAEYWTTLFGFVLTTGLGVWLIPSFVRWTRTKADIRKSNYYHQKIKSLYDDGKLDENDVPELDKLKTETVDAYSRGMLEERHYVNLKNEISLSYDKIFRKRIEGLKNVSNRVVSKEQLNKLMDDIENAFSEQKITETQFNLLGKKISDLGEKNDSNVDK